MRSVISFWRQHRGTASTLLKSHSQTTQQTVKSNVHANASYSCAIQHCKVDQKSKCLRLVIRRHGFGFEKKIQVGNEDNCSDDQTSTGLLQSNTRQRTVKTFSNTRFDIHNCYTRLYRSNDRSMFQGTSTQEGFRFGWYQHKYVMVNLHQSMGLGLQVAKDVQRQKHSTLR